MSKEIEAINRVYLASNVALPYFQNGECYKDYELVLNTVKALEIIKSKRVDTYMLFQGCSLPEYNQKYKSKRTRLLANEYELLREVLK